MSYEKFCLKWTDFQLNLAKAFPLLRHESDFFDVTLVCEDQRKISAHKVVLSSCSQYFKGILKGSQHPNPMICLDGIKFTDVNNILDYVYNGEVKIEEEGLDRFLKIAKRFQLEGISGEAEAEFCSVEETAKSHFSSVIEKFENEIIDTKPSTPHPTLRHNANDKVIKLNNSDSEGFEGTVDELYSKITSAQYNGVWYNCKVCEKGFKKKYHIREHVESHIQGLSFTCEGCNQQFTTSHILRDHMAKRCPSYKLLKYSL